MTPTLTRDPKPTVRPRSYRIVKGAKSEPELYQPRTVKRPPVTVKPERVPFWKQESFWLGTAAIALCFLLTWGLA